MLYNMKIVDGMFESSTRHEYNAWAKCIGSHFKNQDKAVFTIMENIEYDNSPYYIKIIDLDF